MPEPPTIKIDSTINLPLIGTIIAAVAVGSMWVSSVNDHLAEMSRLIVSVSHQDERIGEINSKLGQIDLRLKSIELHGGRLTPDT